MAIVEPVHSSSAYPYYFDCYNSCCYGPTPQELAEMERRKERIKQLCLQAIEFLIEWHSKTLLPWRILGKRFDFRSSPRWSSKRWKSKT